MPFEQDYNNQKVRRMKLALEASFVDRCHTRRVIGEYTVGTHSFNMLTMLRLLYPGVPRVELIWAIHDHDIPERLVGDNPHHAKPYVWHSYNADKIERDINLHIFGYHHYDNLTDEEMKWLVGLDVLEYYAFCLDQRELGNKNFDADIEQRKEFFRKSAHLVPKEIVDMSFQMSSMWFCHQELDSWRKE